MAACKRTRYPSLCYQCLSGMASRGRIETPHQVAQAALSVALYKAMYTRAYMMKVAKVLKAMNPKGRDYQSIQDCTNQLSSGIYQMTQSINELRRLGHGPVGNDFYFHMSNIETWISTTITDAMMCVEEFPGHRMGKVKATIKGKVLNVAMTASNALYLFHSFAQKYVAARALHKP
ncbi:hypothetical protein CDL15_Pgr019353 [Punica granatum]|nr:hypothetical protein CDL15_Pgr019353 [Punica granatum]